MAEMGGEVSENCPICLETLPPIRICLETLLPIPAFLVPCGHTFCLKCCELLFQDSFEPQISCPLCRQISVGFAEKTAKSVKKLVPQNGIDNMVAIPSNSQNPVMNSFGFSINVDHENDEIFNTQQNSATQTTSPNLVYNTILLIIIFFGGFIVWLCKHY
jgi:hypothetical protein